MIGNMHTLFAPGDMIYGYCGGYFGRDHYDDMTCVHVTRKWAIFETEKGYGVIVNWEEQLVTEVPKWKDPNGSYSNRD